MKEYGKYSAIAFELLVIIFAGVYAGWKLDTYIPKTKPLFTVTLSLLSIAVGLYATLKKLTKK